MIGHSLGGSVSLKLVEKYPFTAMRSTTYGAPVKTSEGKIFSTTQSGIRFRHPYDPVSMLDHGTELKEIPIQGPMSLGDTPHNYNLYNGKDED